MECRTYGAVRKLRREAQEHGYGLNVKYNPCFGDYGCILYDLETNTVVAGASPIAFFYSIEDVRSFLNS